MHLLAATPGNIDDGSEPIDLGQLLLTLYLFPLPIPK